MILSKGQPNGNAAGGVKGLNNTFIAGYSRGSGNDFPRIALRPDGSPVVVWNDSSRHPLFGDYTDSATDGTRTYYIWSDGRLGIPQPFVDHS